MQAKLTSKLPKLRSEVNQRMANVLNVSVEGGVELAKQLAPVDTGYLKANIKMGERATSTKLKATMLSQAEYSAFVNFGTSTSAPQPFFTMAAQSVKRGFVGLNARIIR